MGNIWSAKDINHLLQMVVADNSLHGSFLTTLSYLENTGAHLIFRYKKPSDLDLSLLQHAAEEARHAFYFKKQTLKLKSPKDLCLLGGRATTRFLFSLDIQNARLLRRAGYANLHHGCYLLTTYAIETIAMQLYQLYQQTLEQDRSSITVLPLIHEEKGHLEQMTGEIRKDPVLMTLLETSLSCCQVLRDRWLSAVSQEIKWLTDRTC